MKQRKENNRLNIRHHVLLLVAATTLMAGCAAKGPQITPSPMDSPAHHVIVGEQMMAAGELDQAREAFTTALDAAPNYAPALAGMARLQAHTGEVEDALKTVRAAIRHASGGTEEVFARLARMEILVMTQPEPPISEIEKEYNLIEKIQPGHLNASLIMADGWSRSGQTGKAEALYGNLIKAGGSGAMAADRAWKELQTRQRLSDVRAATELAGLSLLTRAQAAALIVEELQGSDLLIIGRHGQADYRFKTPDEEKAVDAPTIAPLPDDTAGHPLARSISLVLPLRLRGLDQTADGRFHPEAPMTRGDMALVLEDLLIIMEKDENLARQLIGGASPFADVSPDSYAFNAILLCVSRDLMHALDNDRFYPDRPVSGMAALQGVRRIKQMMN